MPVEKFGSGPSGLFNLLQSLEVRLFPAGAVEIQTFSYWFSGSTRDFLSHPI